LSEQLTLALAFVGGAPLVEGAPGTTQPVWQVAAWALHVIMQLVTVEVTVELTVEFVEGIVDGASELCASRMRPSAKAFEPTTFITAAAKSTVQPRIVRLRRSRSKSNAMMTRMRQARNELRAAVCQGVRANR
jgi:hypothetical protein